MEDQRDHSERDGSRQGGPQQTRDAGPHGTERWNPYHVLGLAPGAPPEKIKRAYRELASKYHPDKVSHLGEEFKDLAERRFKEIQQAYNELASSHN
jgi:DnaJ like chaperone protein